MSTENYQPFIESHVGESATTLRGRMFRHGYVFVRGALPPEIVLSVRRQMLAVMDEAGWLDSARPQMDGFANLAFPPTSEGKQDYFAVYRKVLKMPEFHNLPEHPNLRDIAGKLLDHPKPFVLS